MTSASKKNTSKSRTNTKAKGRKKQPIRKDVNVAVKNEVLLIAIFAAAIFLFLCVINVIQGTAAEFVRKFMFGIFGLLAYLIPIILFMGFAFGISNKGNTVAVIKLISMGVLVFLLGILSYMLMKQESMLQTDALISSLFETSATYHAGGGVLFGSLAHGLYTLIGFGGTLFVTIVLGIISFVFITERSFLSGVRKSGTYLLETAKEKREQWEAYYDEEEFEFDEEEELRNAREKKKNNRKNSVEAVEKKDRTRRMDKKARGVIPSSFVTLHGEQNSLGQKADIHEIILQDNTDDILKENIHVSPYNKSVKAVEKPQIYNDSLNSDQNFCRTKPVKKSFLDELEEKAAREENADNQGIENMPEPVTEETTKKRNVTEKIDKKDIAAEEDKIVEQIQNQEEPKEKYIFPPISLLKKGERNKGDSATHLKETALRLQQTLQNFGVKVTITDISQGPSVTRYELQPEQGVKVSKIVGLTDDIKLNLAATDIRIEAPIPGKAAVGIEVPNKENSAVALRDIIESQEFKQFSSNLCFAVGKDIGGQVVVTDIAKMPHLLIAGATGSGKSVCINTIIMSILYKADPADVKMIMIDPKVVELSVYNGIPHLMIPVVTDPKKASAALHWGVAEMTERYQKFADLNVRDLKGYNKAVESGKLAEDGTPLKKMPQIVIIVDELADLMMVAAGEVEESICRLAQLARAAGIHLIIATQRPSVDVITGLIKANMPSRVAFSVSSGVDSRTILDMNGAEKLLGKGDMLFYPQGYAKPARIQGAFVSDSEVSGVVNFLKNQMLGNVYNNDIEEKIKTMQTTGGITGSGAVAGNSEVDAYFAEAGKFVIEKDKASIGMLQRVFKIGFNRAARIVDQLEEAGVVGAEEGTKPRKILMSMEQFEAYLQDAM